MIEKLTHEQESKIPEYLTKWLTAGFSSAEITEGDYPLLREYLSLAEIMADAIVLCDSPMACQRAINALRPGCPRAIGLNYLLDDHLVGPMGRHLEDQVDDRLIGRLRGQLSIQLEDWLDDQLSSQLRYQLITELEGCPPLEGEVFGYGHGGPYHEIYGFGRCGNVMSGFCALHDFLISEVEPLETAEQMKVWELFKRFSQVYHYIFPFDGICFVCQKPTQFTVHNDGTISARYRDGYTVSAPLQSGDDAE